MMKQTISNVLLFVTGAVVGSVATWKFVEKKYARIAQEEIDSVKEAFARDCNENKVEESEEMEEPDPSEEEYDEYVETVQNLGYIHEEGGAMMGDKPYVIHPSEFGEKDDYGTETLVYFKDSVLADDMDHRIEDVEAMVGVESLTHFGEYEEDSVHVRNDRLKIDFEILLSEDLYANIEKRHYHLVEENDA
jgi:hypothetical protein